MPKYSEATRAQFRLSGLYTSMGQSSIMITLLRVLRWQRYRALDGNSRGMRQNMVRSILWRRKRQAPRPRRGFPGRGTQVYILDYPAGIFRTTTYFELGERRGCWSRGWWGRCRRSQPGRPREGVALRGFAAPRCVRGGGFRDPAEFAGGAAAPRSRRGERGRKA